jgi:hypothetical protein
MFEAAVIAAADAVFYPALGAVSGFGELDGSARGVGGDQLVALARVVFEQGGQLRTGVDIFPADNPHVGRPAGQPITAGAVTHQPGECGDLGVVASVARRVERGLPGGGGDLAGRGAGPVIKVEAHRIVHLIVCPGVQRADVLAQGVGGPRAVTGDQHPATVRRGDPRDRLGQNLDLIRRGPGPARTGRSLITSDSSVLSHQAVKG